MKIIIIGCGKVGITLAEQLSEENHDLVLIDTSAQKVQEIPEDIDAIRLYGMEPVLILKWKLAWIKLIF